MTSFLSYFIHFPSLNTISQKKRVYLIGMYTEHRGMLHIVAVSSFLKKNTILAAAKYFICRFKKTCGNRFYRRVLYFPWIKTHAIDLAYYSVIIVYEN